MPPRTRRVVPAPIPVVVLGRVPAAAAKAEEDPAVPPGLPPQPPPAPPTPIDECCPVPVITFPMAGDVRGRSVAEEEKFIECPKCAPAYRP